MLSNAYFLAKFRFDTAENEPAKNLQNFANFPNVANPNPYPRTGQAGEYLGDPGEAAGVERRAVRGRELVRVPFRQEDLARSPELGRVAKIGWKFFEGSFSKPIVASKYSFCGI